MVWYDYNWICKADYTILRNFIRGNMCNLPAIAIVMAQINSNGNNALICIPK